MRKPVVIAALIIPALLLYFAGCDNQEKKEAEELKAMETKNKDFVIACTEDFWNTQNIAAFEKYYGANFIMHSSDGDQNITQYKELCQAYFKAFPDLHITTDFYMTEGDKVAKVWTVTSTHKADFMGIQATGKRIMIKGIEVFRIADGKIVEVWASMDNLGMLQQLGVIPPPGQ